MNVKGLISFIILATPWTFIVAGLLYLYNKFKR